MTDPTATRLTTPPGSVLVLRLPADLGDGSYEAAVELHRQTGLPVLVVTDPDAEVGVTTPEEAVAALSRRLEYRTGWDSGSLARYVLEDLAEDGWRLVQLSQP